MWLEHGPLEYAHGDYKYSRSKATSLCSSDDLTARERYYIRFITKNSFESLVLRVIHGMLSTITSWILFEVVFDFTICAVSSKSGISCFSVPFGKPLCYQILWSI